MNPISRLRLLGLSVVAALLLASCGAQPLELELREDLVALFPFAQVSESPGGVGEPEAADEPGRRLFLPYGSRIDFHLRLRPGDVLRAEQLAFRGQGRGRLEIILTSDDHGESLVATLADRQTKLEYRIADDSVAARLSLRAESEEPWSSGSGAVLTAPAVWAPGRPAISETFPEVSPSTVKPRQTPNIVVYLVDTLRPDHLGAYGYSKPTSPHLDRFAKQAHLFEYAVAQSPWTRPSVTSIFTGMTPMAHGTIDKKDKLDSEVPTLPSILSIAGYATAAVFSNPNVSPTFGFDRGFDDVFMTGLSANKTTLRALEWLRSYKDERPFLLYIHTSEPHQPYLASPAYRDRFAPDTDEIAEIIERNPDRQTWEPTRENIRQLRALYDAEIAENDAGFGELVALLESMDLYDSALILYVSDHGEEFFEHRRWGHGRALSVDQLNVALLVKFPGQTRGSRVKEAVQHVDILPTLLDFLGLPIPSSVEGRSLAALAESPEASFLDSDDLVFSHNRTGQQYSVLAGDFKLIQRRRNGVKELKGLYNWREDPRELQNLLTARPIHAAVLTSLIERKKARHQGVSGEEAVLDDAIREELRALGYLK